MRGSASGVKACCSRWATRAGSGWLDTSAVARAAAQPPASSGAAAIVLSRNDASVNCASGVPEGPQHAAQRDAASRLLHGAVRPRLLSKADR